MSEAGSDNQAACEAAEWLARLNSRTVSTDELNAFYEWRRNPANAAAYARGEQLWHETRALGDDREIADAVRAALERPRLLKERRATRRMVLAGGGGAIIAAAAATWWVVGRAIEYRTAVGEQLVVQLEDGSRLRLNTNSMVRVRLSTAERLVDLLRGQVIFDVARDAARPFRVRGGTFAVEALGTRFEVAAIDDRPAHVLLIEGRVAIDDERGAWHRQLTTPGESLSLDDDSSPVLGRKDLTLATSWTTGRLIFRETPLGEAIAEVNRYSRRKIELAAPEQAGLEVGGAFETGDTASFVRAITAIFPLRAQNGGSDLIILTRA